MPRSRSRSRRRATSVPRTGAAGAASDTGRAGRSPAPRRGRSRTARGIATPAAEETEGERAGEEEPPVTPAQQLFEDTYNATVRGGSPADSSGQESARSSDALEASERDEQESEEDTSSDSSADTNGRGQEEDDQSSDDDDASAKMSGADKTKSAAELIAEKMAKGDAARTKEEITANKPLVGRYDRGDAVSQQKLQRNLLALAPTEDEPKVLVRVRAEQLTSDQAKKVAADADDRRDKVEGPLKRYDAAYLHLVPKYEKDAAGDVVKFHFSVPF